MSETTTAVCAWCVAGYPRSADGLTHPTADNTICHAQDVREWGCLCGKCGRRYRVDLLVPDALWPKLAGATELLCPRCIADGLEALGEFAAFRIVDVDEFSALNTYADREHQHRCEAEGENSGLHDAIAALRRAAMPLVEAAGMLVALHAAGAIQAPKNREWAADILTRVYEVLPRFVALADEREKAE